MAEGNSSSPVPSGSRRRMFFGRNVSTSSLSSITTIGSVLPNYSATDSSTNGDSTPSSPNRQSQVPPRYSYVPQSPDSGRTLNADQAQPASPRPIGHHEHIFQVRGNKPWAVLHTYSRDVGEQQPKGQTPRFWGGQSVNGSVVLNLDSTMTIHQITVSVRAKLITGFLDSDGQQILDSQKLLYHKTHGDPRPGTPLAGSVKKFDGKFPAGHYQFSFSIPFPTHIADQPDSTSDFSSSATSPDTPTTPQTPHSPPSYDGAKQPEGVITSPQSFLEHSIQATVKYELVVHMVHGRFRPDSKITAPFTYVPNLVVPPASIKRQQAYEDAALVPGPRADPDGWLQASKTTLRGRLSGKEVAVGCQLYLANPFSYARGTYVPIYLRLTSEDARALAALATPKTPTVRLLRRVSHSRGTSTGHAIEDMAGATHEWGNCSVSVAPTPGPLGKRGSLTSRANVQDCKVVVAEVASAQWWAPHDKLLERPTEGTGDEERWLAGEIHLSKDLKATNDCPLFSVHYIVELLPLDHPSFELEGKSNKALSSYPVEIGTVHPTDTPYPVPFTAPTAQHGSAESSNARGGSGQNDQWGDLGSVFGAGYDVVGAY